MSNEIKIKEAAEPLPNDFKEGAVFTREHKSLLLLDASNNLYVVIEDARGDWRPVHVGPLWIEQPFKTRYPLHKAPVGTSFTITQGEDA